MDSRDLIIQEANKTIAEYMWGNSVYIKAIHDEFYLSLDALVPVWEKLNHCQKELFPRIINKKKADTSYYKVSFFMYGKYSFVEHESDDLKEAACLATAKAIKELD